MKRPTLLLILVILASIFLFFLLNLLLGSVHIPFRSVWNILWGNTDESIIWQNIIWKSPCAAGIDSIGGGSGVIGEWITDADGFPESAGRTVSVGY